MLAIQLDRLSPVRRLGYHGHIMLGIYDRGNTDASDQMILSHEDTEFNVHGSGTITWIRVPWPKPLLRCNSPPSRSALSRIPINPKCPPTGENISFCSK